MNSLYNTWALWKESVTSGFNSEFHQHLGHGMSSVRISFSVLRWWSSQCLGTESLGWGYGMLVLFVKKQESDWNELCSPLAPDILRSLCWNPITADPFIQPMGLPGSHCESPLAVRITKKTTSQNIQLHVSFNLKNVSDNSCFEPISPLPSRH